MQRSLVPLLVLCLLCSSSLAAAAPKHRYLSVSKDDLLGSKRTHVDCPATKKSGMDHESCFCNYCAKRDKAFRREHN
jgi:hypothetical protein